MAFNGKVVLITGGGSGMGRLAAQTLANQGADVAIFDINALGMEETATGFDNIHPWTVDLTDSGAVHQSVIEAEKTLGPVDRLYNAAAIMPLGKILDQNIDTIHKIMEINYGGLINITKAVLPGMVERKQGDFISFASMAGIVPTMLTGAYSASKAAVAMLTEIVYHEHINSGVRFACICPPAVNTPLLDQGRSTVWPKMLDSTGDPMAPKDVIDAIEVALEKGNFWVYPGKQTRMGSLVRRLFPGLIWKQVHQVEGF
jgi:NADP-dependent 3-hydroxy acid dehydrogenase YdfG